MCQFISWIEKDNEVFYLTKKQLNTEKGKKLIEYCGDDIIGHGAIERFYWGNENITGGNNKECNSFSNPLAFPDKIVKSIIEGEFNHKYFMLPTGILTQPALAKYKKIEQLALAKYKKIEQLALAKYEKIEQLAWAKYKKIQQPALAKYEKIQQSALAKYEKIQQPAWAKYKKIQQPALAKYEKIQQPAWAKYKKIQQPAFYKLLKNKSNLKKEWLVHYNSLLKD